MVGTSGFAQMRRQVFLVRVEGLHSRERSPRTWCALRHLGSNFRPIPSIDGWKYHNILNSPPSIDEAAERWRCMGTSSQFPCSSLPTSQSSRHREWDRSWICRTVLVFSKLTTLKHIWKKNLWWQRQIFFQCNLRLFFKVPSSRFGWSFESSNENVLRLCAENR